MSHYLLKADNYETPLWAVNELISALEIKPETRIWCPFHGMNGQMIKILRSHNLNVVNEEDVDFFDDKNVPREFDMILDNPPFSQMQRIVPRALSFGKPVILVLPILNLRTKWIKEITREKASHFITASPSKRVQYDYEGKPTKHCNFETTWFCWNTKGMWWGADERGQIFL